MQPVPAAFVEEFAPHRAQTMLRPLLYVFFGHGEHLGAMFETDQKQPIVVLHVVWEVIVSQVTASADVEAK
ncbi:MAG: hypothetical protein R8N50_00480 [Alphaproteobacteria bacterium]|nr:hypothetical protein [Alphaproteobacteria bacterium]